MQQFTGSISRGDAAPAHNTRSSYLSGHSVGDVEWIAANAERLAKKAPNIDFARSRENVVIADRAVEDVYDEQFGAALAEYNAKQVDKGHPERQIPDYLDHVRGSAKQHEVYEFVVQVGNVGAHPDEPVSIKVFREWLARMLEQADGHWVLKQAVVHVDEGVPHMHVGIVPVAASKRGLPVQNSLNKAIEQAGYESYKSMLAEWDLILADVMREHGIERISGDREKQMGGVDIATFKRSMRAAEDIERAEAHVADLDEYADRLVEAIADAEREADDAEARSECLRRVAGFVGDVDGIAAEVDAVGAAIEDWASLEAGRRDEVLGRVDACRDRVREIVSRIAGRIAGVIAAVERWLGEIEAEEPSEPEQFSAAWASYAAVERERSQGREHAQGRVGSRESR